MHQLKSMVERGLRGRIGRRLFHRLVEQHGCTEKSLEQRVVQFVGNARTLLAPLLQANVFFAAQMPFDRLGQRLW